jgi:hypothetical protein
MWCETHPNTIPNVSGPLYNYHISTKGYKMPNWVYNTLTIQGPKSEVDMIKDRLNKPFVLAQETYGMGDISSSGFPTKITQVEYNNPVFAFNNIHSYKDDGITDEEYACQPTRSGADIKDPNWFAQEIAHAKTQKDWYSWNNTNWGTKWDVAVRDGDEYPNTELIEYKSEGDDNWVVYRYETAWSPAVTILTKLSNLVPNCLLTLEYEEETGWGGEYEIVRGEVKEILEYENRCCECDSYNTLDYCENDCGEFCSKCEHGSWRDEEAMKECQTHMLTLPLKTYTQEEALNV